MTEVSPRPKKVLSVEEEVLKIRRTVAELRKEREIFFNFVRQFIKTGEAKMMTAIRRTIKEAEKINGTLDKHKEFLEKVTKTNENVEETLCNVLLAIRQNEYLQAWYPAQRGYTETKVSGIHPSNIKLSTNNEDKDVV